MSVLVLAVDLPVRARTQTGLPVVRGITVTGSHVLVPARIRLNLRPGHPLRDSLLQADRSTLLDTLAELGYLWSEITVTAETTNRGVTLHFQVTDRERARIGSIGLTGNRRIATPVLRRALPFTEGPFRPGQISSNAWALVRFYSDNGFPFCVVHPETLLCTGREISYQLAISEGPEVRLADVEFRGQLETRPDRLRRLFRLPLNTLYSESEVQRRITRLRTDPLLECSGFDVRRRGEDYILSIQARERKSNRISGLAGYSATTRELAGALSLSLGNLFGTRRTASLSWQRSLGRQDLDFTYTEPWLLNTPIFATATIRNRVRDTTYSATELGLLARFELSDIARLSLSSNYGFTAGIPATRTIWLGSGLEIDTRDRYLNPACGFRGSTVIQVGSRQSAAGYPAQAIVRSLLDLGVATQLAGPWRLSLAGHGRIAAARESLHSYDQFELGGARTLRGYRESEFSATRCLWLNSELCYLPSPLSRVYPFFDCALLADPVTSLPKWYPGFGVGLALESATGLVQLDYGLRPGTSPLRGKIHVALQTAF